MKSFDRNLSYLSLLKNKKDFILYVYLNVILQVFITLIVINIFRKNEYASSVTNLTFWLYIILLSVIVFILTSYLKNSSFWIKLTFFIIYAVINGALLYHIGLIIPKDIIDQVLIGNILIFLSLYVFTYVILYFNYNINIVNLLFIASVIGIIIDIILYFIYKYKDNLADINKLIQDNQNISSRNKVLLYSGLFIYTIYLYYTSNVVLRYNYEGDIILSSMDMYFGYFNTIIYSFYLDKYL